LFDSMLHLGIVCVAFWAAARQRRMLLPGYLRYYTLGVLGVLILLQYAQGFSVFTFFLGNPTFISDPEFAEIIEQGQIPEALEFTITVQLILFIGMGILGLLLSAVYSLGRGKQSGTAES
ncbi:MAG: hypothetical protein IT368_15940, partial [Candidatus Hydrogenedentes bacterium]|nr:hypothetical protein [Candidatus Hydrogenedentota bacterium]